MAPRDRPSLVLALALGGSPAGCRSDAPPPGVTDVRIEAPRRYHADEGFVPLVPPVHLPSSSPERDQVEIWVKLPPDGLIDVRLDERQRPVLRFPPGTWADRVEFAGRGDARRIVDIRGTRIEPDERQTFYVFRPTAPDPDAPLFGVEWPREDAGAHRAATERLLSKLTALPPAATMDDDARHRFLEGVRVRNGCAGCHGLARPDNEIPKQHGLVDRGTDDSGLFTPQTVLWDEVALEAYGAHDRSWSDPAIEVRCGDRALDAQDPQDARRCPDGSIAQGRLRWDATEPVARAHLAQVCEGRRILTAHMTPENRAKISPAMGPCEKN
ncbi:MAG: hypothetical protein KDK70_37995 [Myxococcales bacterium]|nr:hypothetical protein [Myxococcales bacterium]